MLDTVELNERVRVLKPLQRLGYTVAVALGMVLAFWSAIVASVLLAGVLVVALVGGPLTVPDDLVALGLPLFIIFTFIIGLTGVGAQARLLSGQNLGKATWLAARSGMTVGLISGALFGLCWSLLVSADPLMFAVIMGLSLAVPLAFFRVIACIIEPVSLRLVTGQNAVASR